MTDAEPKATRDALKRKSAIWNVDHDDYVPF
jgi:hypothetical protein